MRRRISGLHATATAAILRRMSDDLFESPKALLNWAWEDMQRFKEVERAFFESEPYQTVVEFDDEMQRNAHRLRFTQPIPYELRKLASHIINDLRHSLDQAFCTAAKFFGWEPCGNQTVIYFPWATTKADLMARLKRIPVEIHPILFEAEPYPAQNDGSSGNDMIRQLGKIAGPNKHEAVLNAAAIASITGMRVAWNADWVIPYPENMWNSAKNELTMGYFPKETKGNYQADFAFFVAFSEAGLAGHGAANLFDYWGSYANHFVKRFEGRVAESRSA
jgi:hypothetical protein